MSPGLRDPLGLDGSHRPESGEAASLAFRQQLRRIQPGLALIVDAFDHLRHRGHQRDGRRDAEDESPGAV